MRGCAFAIAHVRGGGGFGNQWHLAGSRLNRKRSVDDFVAACRFLREVSGKGASLRVGAEGRSAGALLVGVSYNRTHCSTTI